MLELLSNIDRVSALGHGFLAVAIGMMFLTLVLRRVFEKAMSGWWPALRVSLLN